MSTIRPNLCLFKVLNNFTLNRFQFFFVEKYNTNFLSTMTVINYNINSQ